MSDMINEEEKIGKISIADGVVASIAGIAAIEVEGVSKLTGNISKELVAKLGKKNLANLQKLLEEVLEEPDKNKKEYLLERVKQTYQ